VVDVSNTCYLQVIESRIELSLTLKKVVCVEYLSVHCLKNFNIVIML